jgi:hypothetical protein
MAAFRKSIDALASEALALIRSFCIVAQRTDDT